jgi:hypothetical protein
VSLADLILGPPPAECVVCGRSRCTADHFAGVHPIDQHRPLADEPHTTAVELGYPAGIHVRYDGVTVQDGTEDGYLLYGPADLIPLSMARRLGLLPSVDSPPPEVRAVHGPREDRRRRLREDRRAR